MRALIGLAMLAGCAPAEAQLSHNPRTRIAIGEDIWVLSMDGRLRCFDGCSGEDADAPDGLFVDLDSEGRFSCALDDRGRLACWGPWYEVAPPDAEGFIDVAVGKAFGCALDADGEATCWGRVAPIIDRVPPGPWVELTANEDDAVCARAADGTTACWGTSTWKPPPGKYTSIAVDRFACGVLPNAQPDCWGGTPAWIPHSNLSILAFGQGNLCAIMIDQSLMCFGPDVPQYWTPPEGAFVAASVGFDTACALTPDDEIVCWGPGFEGVLSWDED